MKIFTAMIVDENCPTLLLALTEEKLLEDLKKEVSWLEGINEAESLDDVVELFEEQGTENNIHAGIFTHEKDV